ncbi:energy-coupling factor transporter transmembrane component T [Candidatus Hecatella orcuttiae]|jgi:energy-coupling factor transport system permease protein|uniref:energy-coupling factor transporter transmembrane component T family protein n=1 Tax=Candidatus Hecatella orcuttiae TaxID=1935119 RepID=UPI002867E984|nr:energy-coupling factor transporter transmembrane component T [Candidatus Hecatella orcuttiae]
MIHYKSFKFKKGFTLLHRLDPRVKFFLACVNVVGALVLGKTLPLLVILASMLPLTVVGRITKEWLTVLKGASVFAAVIFALNFFFSVVGVTGRPLDFSIAMALRFLILISSFSIFFLTTAPDDFSLAVQKARIPFDVSFALTMAMRFVPVLAAEARSIADAQRSRGLELEGRNLLRRAKNYLPILIPLVANSLRRSMELAEAMESRGYGVKKQRTSLYSLKFRRTDLAALGLAVLALFFIVFTRIYVKIPTIVG